MLSSFAIYWLIELPVLEQRNEFARSQMSF